MREHRVDSKTGVWSGVAPDAFRVGNNRFIEGEAEEIIVTAPALPSPEWSIGEMPQTETVEEFLARGGVVKQCPPPGSGMSLIPGTVKHFITLATGLWWARVIGDNGAKLVLTRNNWKRDAPPVKGDRVKFQPRHGQSGKLYAIYCEPEA